MVRLHSWMVARRTPARSATSVEVAPASTAARAAARSRSRAAAASSRAALSAVAACFSSMRAASRSSALAFLDPLVIIGPSVASPPGAGGLLSQGTGPDPGLQAGPGGVMRVCGPRGSFLARRRPPGLASSRSWWEAWGHSVNELSRCAPQGCQAARIAINGDSVTISSRTKSGSPSSEPGRRW